MLPICYCDTFNNVNNGKMNIFQTYQVGMKDLADHLFDFLNGNIYVVIAKGQLFPPMAINERTS